MAFRNRAIPSASSKLCPSYFGGTDSDRDMLPIPIKFYEPIGSGSLVEGVERRDLSDWPVGSPNYTYTLNLISSRSRCNNIMRLIRC